MTTNQRIPEPIPGAEPPVCGTVQVPLCDRVVTADLSGDFSLPDYQPEIKRLLRIGVSATPPAHYEGGNGVDLAGNVDYFVLYMGNDDQVYCAPLSTEYRMQVPFDEGAEGNVSEPFVCVCSVSTEGVAGRVTAPRRLNIRCRVRTRAHVYGERSLSCPDEAGLVPGSVERLESHAQVGRVYGGTSDLTRLQDDMILPPGTDVRVVCAEGQVMINESSAGTATVTCRGEVTLKLLLAQLAPPEMPVPPAGNDAEPTSAAVPPAAQPAARRFDVPTVALRRVPFTVTLDMPGVTPDCAACAYGACSELSVQVEEGRIHTDLGVMVEATAQRSEEISYTGDLFSTRSEGECRFADCTADRTLHVMQGNFTLSDSLSLAEAGIDPSAQIVDIQAAALPESVSCSKGRSVLSGTCRFQLLLCRAGDWSMAEVSLPFRYESDLPVGADAAQPAFDGTVTVITTRSRMDGERLGLDAELAVSLRLTEAKSLHMLAGIRFGADIPRNRGEYVICFPTPTDTLWTVARRYHAPLTALAAANELPASASPDSADSLAGMSYLIV